MTLNVPCVDFELVRLGEQPQTTLILTNSTPLEGSWTLKEKNDHKQDYRSTQVVSSNTEEKLVK